MLPLHSHYFIHYRSYEYVRVWKCGCMILNIPITGKWITGSQVSLYTYTQMLVSWLVAVYSDSWITVIQLIQCMLLFWKSVSHKHTSYVHMYSYTYVSSIQRWFVAVFIVFSIYIICTYKKHESAT